MTDDEDFNIGALILIGVVGIIILIVFNWIKYGDWTCLSKDCVAMKNAEGFYEQK